MRYRFTLFVVMVFALLSSGCVYQAALSQGNLLEQFPNLTSVLELSPPFHYQPGDCTVHHGYAVHGGPPNSTDKPRWSYLFSYAPSDTRYWNGNAGNWGSERKRLGDADNPLVPAE